jgi:hypothetical protein
MFMPKIKVKVYFYHLFILTLVMLLCFYLLYRDMKRIESNMMNLFNRCNDLDKLITTKTQTIDQMCINPDVVESDVVEHNVVESDVVETEVVETEVVESDVVESDVVEPEVVESESDEDSSSDDEDTNETNNDVVKLLQKVTLNSNNSENVEDDVTKLLNSIDNQTLDYSSLNKEELLSKTNIELKDYLKKINKSTSGNKDQLVENILN